MHIHNAVLKTLHQAAETLGKRNALREGKNVKPRVGKEKASQAAATMGYFSHSPHKTKKKKK